MATYSVNITNSNDNRQRLYQEIEALVTQNENRPGFLVELINALRTFFNSGDDEKHHTVGKLMEVVNKEFAHTCYRLALCQVVEEAEPAATLESVTNNNSAESNIEQDILVYQVDENNDEHEEEPAEILDFLMDLGTATSDHAQKAESGLVSPKRKRMKSIVTTTPDMANGGYRKIYHCQYCDKTFRRADYLARHRRTHTGEKPYKCMVCSKRFADKSNFKVHMRYHTGEKPYPCSKCELKFRTRYKLQRHSYSHMPEADKAYHCKECNMSFAAPDYLQSHMKVKHGEKNFKCTQCNKLFALKSKLNSHVKCVHEKVFNKNVHEKESDKIVRKRVSKVVRHRNVVPEHQYGKKEEEQGSDEKGKDILLDGIKKESNASAIETEDTGEQTPQDVLYTVVIEELPSLPVQ